MANIEENEDVKWLYDKMRGAGVNTGSMDDFRSSLDNDEDRKWYYQKAKSLGLDFKDEADFNSVYAAKAQSSAANVQQKAASLTTQRVREGAPLAFGAYNQALGDAAAASGKQREEHRPSAQEQSARVAQNTKESTERPRNKVETGVVLTDAQREDNERMFEGVKTDEGVQYMPSTPLRDPYQLMDEQAGELTYGASIDKELLDTNYKMSDDFHRDIEPLIEQIYKEQNAEFFRRQSEDEKYLSLGDDASRVALVKRNMRETTDAEVIAKRVQEHVVEEYSEKMQNARSMEEYTRLKHELNFRVEKYQAMLIDYLVKRNTPKDDAEYWAKNFINSSVILSAATKIGSSQLERQTQAEGLASYDAPTWAKVSSGVVGMAFDAPLFKWGSAAMNPVVRNILTNIGKKALLRSGAVAAELTAEQMTTRALMETSGKIVSRALPSAASFGGYSVFSYPVQTYSQGGEYSVWEHAKSILTESVKGAALGMYSGWAADKTMTLGGGKRIAAKSGAFLGEVGMFTAFDVTEQLAHGVKFRDIDFGEAFEDQLAFIGGLKMQHVGGKVLGLAAGTKAREWKQFPQKFIEEFTAPDVREINGVLWMRNNRKLFTENDYKELAEFGIDARSLQQAYGALVASKTKGQAARKASESNEFVLDAYDKIMNSRAASDALKSKVMFLMEGVVTTRQPIMCGYGLCQAKDGKGTWLQTYGESGEVIESEYFANEESARRAAADRNYDNQSAVGNMLSVTRMVDQAIVFMNEQSVCEKLGIDREKLNEAKRKSRSELTDEEKAMLREFEDGYKEMSENGTLIETTAHKYGLDDYIKAFGDGKATEEMAEKARSITEEIERQANAMSADELLSEWIRGKSVNDIKMRAAAEWAMDRRNEERSGKVVEVTLSDGSKAELLSGDIYDAESVLTVRLKDGKVIQTTSNENANNVHVDATEGERVRSQEDAAAEHARAESVENLKGGEEVTLLENGDPRTMGADGKMRVNRGLVVGVNKEKGTVVVEVLQDGQRTGLTRTLTMDEAKESISTAKFGEVLYADKDGEMYMLHEFGDGRIVVTDINGKGVEVFNNLEEAKAKEYEIVEDKRAKVDLPSADAEGTGAAPTEAPEAAAPETEEPKKAQSALEQLPLKKNGRRDFTQGNPSVVAEALMEVAGGDIAKAKQLAENQLAFCEQDLAKAQKELEQGVKASRDPEADMEAEAKLRDKIESIKATRQHFQDVLSMLEDIERDPVRIAADDEAAQAKQREYEEKQLEFAMDMADQIGFEFNTKAMGENGYSSYSAREIWLNEALRNGTPVWRSILGHELTHAAKDVNEKQGGNLELYRQLASHVEKAMGTDKFNAEANERLERYNRWIDKWNADNAEDIASGKKMAKKLLDIHVAQEEVVSDWIGENLFEAEPERVKELLERVSKNDGNAEGFLKSALGMLEKAWEVVKKIFGAKSEEAAHVEMAKRAWESMYEYAARLEKDRKMAAEEKANESDEKHSLRVLEAKPWEKDGERITDKDVMEQRGEVESVKYSINKSDEIEQNSNSYYDTYYEGEGEKDKRFMPIKAKDGEHAITRQELDVANAVIREMVDYMKPFMDATSEGKRVLPEEVYGKGIKGQTIMDNGSYGRTMENTTLCLRTLSYNDFVDNVKKRLGRPLTQEESFLASQMVYEIARDPQCLYCYVSLDRKAYDDFLLKYLKGRDAIVEKFNALPESKKNYGNKAPHEAFADLYAEFLEGRKDTKNMKARFDMWIDTVSKGGKLLTADQLTTQEVRSAIREGEDKNLAAQMVDAEAYAQGASWAKKSVDYRSYTGELLKLSTGVINKLKNEYGLRFYSFSEYTPAFIVENMQMVRDAALRGLKGLAYTKETDFVKIFAPTGMNINCSIYGREDAEGNIVADTRQGADWEEVKKLREQYGNVGCVFVATNDKMVEWALEQDFIDVIIPFHIVRTGDNIADFYGWENYSSEQADKQIGGSKKKYISPTEHHNDKETFLRLCEEQGYMPRFHKWLNHPNYMRLVNETRRSVDETDVIKPNFNMEEAKVSFDNFVDKGGYYGGWWDVDEKGYQEAVERVVNDVNEGRRANEVDYGRQDMPINTDKLMQTARKHRQHMNKPIKFGDKKMSLPKEEEMFEQPVKREDESMGEFAQRMRDYNQAEAERAKVDATNVENVTEMDGSADVKYSIVKDEKELERLNNDPKGYIEAYCSVAKIGDLYYSPMATKTTERYTTKNGKQRNRRVMSEGMRLGDWDRSVERTADDPNIRVTEDGRWEYHLVKPDGSDMWVAYNPYEHSTMSPLNDQFTSAYHRPELRIVKVRIPLSDLDGYKAEGAKDGVGEMPWHEGPVAAALKGTPNERKVILSRYRQIVEEVSVEDEADAIYEILKDKDVRIPINVVCPELREELAKRGLKFGEIKGQVAEKDVPVLNEILARINGEEPTTPGGGKPSEKSEGTGAKGFREASTEELRSFDSENGTEFEKFAESINNGNSSLVSQKFFHIGNTGELLNSFGLKGNITIGRKALKSGRHSNSKGHNLGSGNWLDVIKSINNPIAITRYKDRNNSYRVYTNVEFDGGKICVGVDVNVVGKNIEVTNIHTAFTRELKDMLRSSNERLIYPSEEKIKQHIGQSSSKHNAEIYDQHTASDGKGTNNSSTDQTNDAKLSLPRDEEYAKAVESGDEEKQNELVKAAAKAAMPETKVVDKNGDPLKVYHGTNNGRFHIFDNSKKNEDLLGSAQPTSVFFFSSSPVVADGYRSYAPKQFSFEFVPKKTQILKWNAPKKWKDFVHKNRLYPVHRDDIVDMVGAGIPEKYVEDQYYFKLPNGNYQYGGDTLEKARSYYEGIQSLGQREYEDNEVRVDAFLNMKNPALFDADGKGYVYIAEVLSTNDELKPFIREWRDDVGNYRSSIDYDGIKNETNYDGIIIRNIHDPHSMYHDELATDYIVFDSNQIKSADAITRDDNGNVIPLSERFNSEKDDIRYSLPKDASPMEQIMHGLKEREDDVDNKRREEDMRLLNNRLAEELMVAAERIRRAHDMDDDALVDQRTSDAFTAAQEAADIATREGAKNMRAARRDEARFRDELQTEITRITKRLISGMDGVGQKELNELLAEMRDVQKAKTTRNLVAITQRIMDTVLNARERKAKEFLDKALKVRGKGISASGGNAMKSMDEAHAKTIEGLRKRISINMGTEELTEEKNRLLAQKSEMDETELTDVQKAKLDEVNRQLNEIALYETYRMSVSDYDANIRSLKQELAEAETHEQSQAIREAIIEERTKKLKAMGEFIVNLKKFGVEGALGKRNFLMERQAMEDEVNHAVNSDTKGLRIDVDANDGFAWFGGLSTLNGIMKFFGRRAADGKGRLWHMFIPAHQEAIETRQLGLEHANEMLNAISKEYGYKTWSDMGKYAKGNSGTLYRIEPKREGKKLVLDEEGKPIYERKAYTMTLDNLLYIHACEKMSDGRMKLRKMGITEAEVERIRDWFMEDPKRKALMEAIDRCQNDVLSSLKDKYNVTHRKLFGVAMSDVEDYFPLRLDKRSVNTDEQVGGNNGSVMPSTMTGAIKKRVRNSLPLDITGTGAFEVVLSHILEMETWNAFAPLKERANMLLNNKNLKHAVDSMKGIYGSGQTLLDTLKDNLEVATECYKPKNSSLSKIALAFQSGITLRNIAYNLNTARKQLTSIWAELGYADPVHILRNVFRMPLGNYFWAMENLPSLRARIDDADMGYHELKEMDKTANAFKVLDKLRAVGRVGMIPNKMIDVWVCAHVARACYDTQLAYYKKSGLSQEVAERKAKTDAEIAFNETQQSSQGAFLSELQSRHSIGSTMLTTYRNSPMSYQRVVVDASRNLRRQLTNRSEMIEQRKNMWLEQGVDEKKALENAKRDYLRGYCQNVGQLAAVFTMNLAWYLSPTLAYMVFGKDDEKKKEMAKNAFWLGLTDDFVQGIPGFGPAANSFVGNVLKKGGTMKNVFESAWNGDWKAFQGATDNIFPSLLLFEEVGDSMDNIFSGEITKMALGVSNHLGAIGFGASPKVVGNIVNGVINACKYDMDKSKKWLFGIMSVMSHPKDAQEQIFVDLVLDALGDDYAERVEESEDGKVSVKGMEMMNDYYGEILQAWIEFNRGRDLGIMGIGYDAEKTEEEMHEHTEDAMENGDNSALAGRWYTSAKSEEKAIKRLQKLINERNQMHMRAEANGEE